MRSSPKCPSAEARVHRPCCTRCRSRCPNCKALGSLFLVNACQMLGSGPSSSHTGFGSLAMAAMIGCGAAKTQASHSLLAEYLNLRKRPTCSSVPADLGRGCNSDVLTCPRARLWRNCKVDGCWLKGSFCQRRNGCRPCRSMVWFGRALAFKIVAFFGAATAMMVSRLWRSRVVPFGSAMMLASTSAAGWATGPFGIAATAEVTGIHELPNRCGTRILQVLSPTCLPACLPM
mmetsp:Transcript_38421/g.98084  ORF Transcript_38421/g.98084 Transcript_38421/m.98084 type:complete len:232 (-) Transcript_38421:13-708(-)